MTEFPFWFRWYVNRTLASDITSVDYVVYEYNESTDSFDSLASGSVGSAVAGKWIVPFTVPVEDGLKIYLCEASPNGGSHPDLSEQIEATDGIINGANISGSGNESHSGTVCDSTTGNPLEGVIVRAVPYGTTFTYATDTTDVNGEYTLNGLHVNHAYLIEFNKDGFWEKQSSKVVV